MLARFQFALLVVVAISLIMTSLVLSQAKPPVQGKKIAITRGPVAATQINTLAAAPGTISFTANDPDTPTVTGSPSSTATFELQAGAPSRTWTLGVQAGASTFTGCTTVPASAVRATCSSATVVNLSGSGATAACGGAAALSTSPVTVASGAEGTGKDDFTISVTFTLTDSWRYIAATSPTCPLSLTYTLTAP